jgi:hypothetical protein
MHGPDGHLRRSPEPTSDALPTTERDALADGGHSALDQLAQEETTARASLTRERQDALDRQARMAGWFMLFGVGPAALVAIVLALVTDRPDLVWPFFGLGVGVQIRRIWKEQRQIARIERELEDPIDGS